MRRTLAALVAGLTAAVLAPVRPAHAAYSCPHRPAAAAISSARPYENDLLNPERLGGLATGAGVRVAVIDSGVDAGHPQLGANVSRGRDFLHGNADGRQDCIGHGTGVASIIAAVPAAGTGMRGLAPDATIVPVRVSEETDSSSTSAPGASPTAFAEAIRWAADPGGGNADVLNLSLVTTDDDPLVRAAIEGAVSAGVVVVAAVGNHADDDNPTPYPAAYPGVIGVAAVDRNGVRGSFSQHGDYVDISAPGVGVTFAALTSGHTSGSGTSFATPFVAATAALLLQRFPGATPDAVLRRLTATADPAPGGSRSDGYGYGLLDPYRALTEALSTADASAAAAVPAHDPALALATRRQTHAARLSVLAAASGLTVILLVALAGVVLRRGRRRGWET